MEFSSRGATAQRHHSYDDMMTSPEAGGDSDANSDESEEVYSRGSSIDVQRKHYTDAQHTNYKEVQHTSYTDVQRTHYTDVHTLNTERNIEHTRLAVAAALAAVLMLLQAIGSWVSGSVAVLYDSGHLLCDSCGLLAVLAASKTAQKLPSQRFTFGYLRAEVLGCLATLQLMWVVTAMLVYESALRVAGLQYASLDADLMIGSALLGFAGYLALAVILRSGLKSPHSLCCIKSITNSSDQTKPFLETSHVCSVPSPAFLTRVTLLHVYGDTAMAACVLVSALVIRMQPAWKLLDPVLTIMGGGAVVACTLPALRDTLQVLLEGCPAHVSISAVQETLEEVQGVRCVQSIQIWALSFSVSASSVHLILDSACDRDAVQQRVVQVLQQRFSVQQCTVQVQRSGKQVQRTSFIRK